MKTKGDIVNRALRRLGVVAMDESATDDQDAVAVQALDSLRSELSGSYGVFLESVDYVNDDVFLPLTDLLAAEIAAEFLVNPPVSRASALVRLRATMNPNDHPAAEAEGAYF